MRQNTESSIEQLKIEFCIIEKADNSIATKMHVTLINDCGCFWNIFSALHSSMNKLCSAFFKCENKLQICW